MSIATLRSQSVLRRYGERKRFFCQVCPTSVSVTSLPNFWHIVATAPAEASVMPKTSRQPPRVEYSKPAHHRPFQRCVGPSVLPSIQAQPQAKSPAQDESERDFLNLA